MISKHSKSRLLKSLSVSAVLASIFVSGNGLAENTEKSQVDESVSGITEISLVELTDQELIKLLTHEDYSMRQKATKAIWRRGRPVLQTLTKTLESSNPELLYRANQIINYIRVGITPDTPPEITELVKSFPEAEKDEKQEILSELYDGEYYPLMLFLISEIDDQRMARSLYNDYDRLAYNAAEKSVQDGDLLAAIAQFKLAPINPEIRRTLAFLYKHGGLLSEELEKVEKLPQTREKSAWKLALLLAQEDRLKIRKYAQNLKLENVLTTLDLLEGDPNSIIDSLSEDSPFIARPGIDILKAQYAGVTGEEMTSKYEALQKTLSLFEGNKQTDLINQIVKTFALTGAKDLMEDYLVENYPSYAFNHFVYLERPQKALECIGVVDEKSSKEYVQKETDLAIENYLQIKKDNPFDDGLEIDTSNLLQLAEFYYERNQIENAKAAVRPLLEKTNEFRNEEWETIIISLIDYGMYELGVDFIVERSKNDEVVFDTMIFELFDDVRNNKLIWTTLHQREGVTKEQAFRDFLLLTGVGKEKVKEYNQLQDDLLKIGKQKGAEDFKNMQTALSTITVYRQDYVNHVKYAKVLLDEEEKLDNTSLLTARKHDYLRALTCTVDFKSLVSFLEEDETIIRNSSKRYAIYSIAQRKLGNTKAADELLEHAKLLSMGLTYKLLDIAEEHSRAGYHNHCLEIMEQALVSTSDEIGNRSYDAVLGNLAKLDTSYIQTKQWSKAAAFSMVNSVFLMMQSPRDVDVEYSGIYLNMFYNLSFTKGMELYQNNEREKGLRMLNAAHDVMVGHGLLADHFYPAIRTLDLEKEYDNWLDDSYQHLKSSINVFPECANTYNTMAWILSRAVRKLDEGIKYSKKSHELSPFEAAYLDTMAEVWHAKGDREKAIEWGEKAVNASMYGKLRDAGSSNARIRTLNLAEQLERFRYEPHPKP